MTVRLWRLLGLGFATAFVGGCSSSSSGSPAVVQTGDASSNGGSGGGADDSAAPIMDAAPAALCDAVSLAPAADASAAACFECQAMQCASETAACSTDCACAPAYSCLERNSTAGSLNSGYSQCNEAVDALMNGNAALMGLADCAAANCKAACFGDGG
jgi:hypothetical protein